MRLQAIAYIIQPIRKELKKMKKKPFIHVWQLVISILFFVEGLYEFIALATNKTGAEHLWGWLLGIPIGAIGIFWSTWGLQKK